MTNQPTTKGMSAATGRELEPLKAGSPEWFATMSASKIAAVVGTSPYESRFSLWHRMAGILAPQEQNDQMTRGHYLEPAIVAWFADQHPDYDVTPATHWGHAIIEWATATPDRDLCTPEGPAILECKADDSPEWDCHTNTIPKGYYGQVQWQLACSNLPLAFVARLGPWLEFEQYTVTADREYQEWLIREATEFMDSLPGGSNPQPPNLDGHTETLMAVRTMNPEVGDGKHELDVDLGMAYLAANVAVKEADEAKRLATAQVLTELNATGAKQATLAGEVIASKRARGDKPAYLQAAPTPKENAT